MRYLETTSIGMGFAGHERRASAAPRAVDVVAGRTATLAALEEQQAVAEVFAPVAGEEVEGQ